MATTLMQAFVTLAVAFVWKRLLVEVGLGGSPSISQNFDKPKSTLTKILSPQ